jgi:chemotaxis protein CheZ
MTTPSLSPSPSTESTGDTAEQLITRIALLTQHMSEGLRDLGLNQGVALAAEAIPNARERLNYVAQMTEQAAERVLNAVDAAQPIQFKLSKSAGALTKRWDVWFANPVELDQARELVLDTRSYLAEVPTQVSATTAQLMEIMMAQDFQDLTGQVIKKMLDVIHDLEAELMQLLLDNVPVKNLAAASLKNKMLNGPQIMCGNFDAVDDQAEVDALLESLSRPQT